MTRGLESRGVDQIGPISSVAIISYKFVPISATPGTDYIASDGIINFTPGKLWMTIICEMPSAKLDLQLLASIGIP